MSRAARVYLDWNATTPLCPEARAAMAAAMESAGNPSSVHAEGRAARGVIERARVQVAEAFGADPAEVVFTSGATEAAALALVGRDLAASAIEHDCVAAWTRPVLPVGPDGRVGVADPAGSVLQAANSETGVLQHLPAGLALIDAAQIAGKAPFAFRWSGAAAALLSGHKFGGPKGVGALLLRDGTGVAPAMRGGGQEAGRRAGTENLVGIAGFGAAAAAAMRDLADGAWERVAELRNILEGELEAAAQGTILVGKASPRVPNTICLATPGWKGETQVMQMDLDGFSVSSGSACSSGKVRTSRVLQAMGLGDVVASGAIRVSLGITSTRNETDAFAAAWIRQHRRFQAKAAVAA